MKVVLAHNLASLGKRGDIKEVNDGYAMNFLIPQGQALLATKHNIKKLSQPRRSIMLGNNKSGLDFNVLRNITINFQRKSSSQGHLFQAVHTNDVIKYIKDNYGLELVAKYFVPPIQLKSIGQHKISMVLPNQELINFTINIKKENS